MKTWNLYFLLAYNYSLIVYIIFFSLAHRTTQTPAASSPAAKTTSLGLAD